MSTKNETEPVEIEAQVGHLSTRTLTVTILCLLVVLLVMAFSLIYVTTIANTAQRSATRQEQQNTSLRIELECRARGQVEFDLARGRLDAAVAQALVDIAERGTTIPSDLDIVRNRLAEQEAAADQRQADVSDCSEVS